MLVRKAGKPQGAGRLFHLDVVRGVAILLVLGTHTPAVLRLHPVVDALSDAVHKMGHLGVDLFFVLSGFLIGGMLFRELDATGTLRVRRFLIRRAFKIWPAYLICLVVTSLAIAALGRDLADDPHPYRTMAAAMWPAALHVQNYFASTGYCFWFWSLGVEEHFYLALPAVLLLVGGTGRPARLQRLLLLGAVVAVGCLALRAWTRAVHPTYSGVTHYWPTHLRTDALIAGVVLAAATRYAPGAVARLRPYRWPLAATGVALLLVPVLFPDGEEGRAAEFAALYPFDCTLAWLGSVALVLLAHYLDQGPARQTCRTSRWARSALAPVAVVGGLSYSIYLWHGFFAAPLSRRLLERAGVPLFESGLSTALHLGVYVAIAFGLGLLSYWLIEKPFLALRDRVCSGRQAAAAAGERRAAAPGLALASVAPAADLP
jgi:peptidoglycan/LPS O-acetylase OafA/YrhL